MFALFCFHSLRLTLLFGKQLCMKQKGCFFFVCMKMLENHFIERKTTRSLASSLTETCSYNTHRDDQINIWIWNRKVFISEYIFYNFSFLFFTLFFISGETWLRNCPLDGLFAVRSINFWNGLNLLMRLHALCTRTKSCVIFENQERINCVSKRNFP